MNEINLEVLLLFTSVSQTFNHYFPEEKFKTLKKNVFFADLELMIYLNLVNQKLLLYLNSSFIPKTIYNIEFTIIVGYNYRGISIA